MFSFPSRSNNRPGLLIECSKLTCFAREKNDMVPGRRDRRSTPVAVRCTCGAESEFEEGKIGRGRRVQTQNMKKKTMIDTQIRVQTSTSSTGEFEAPPAECSMHAPAYAVVWQWHSIDPALHAVDLLLYCHATINWAVWRLFCSVEGRCCLAPAWSGVKRHDNEADKRQEHVRQRKKKGTASTSVRTTRTVSKDANFDAPCGGFDSFSSLGLFFFGNNVLWTTVDVLAFTFRSTCKTGGRC